MGHPRVRIYYGPETATTADPHHDAENRVTVPLEEICELLTDAVMRRRTWVQDFADEEVTISADLYDVLLAYQHYRR